MIQLDSTLLLTACFLSVILVLYFLLRQRSKPGVLSFSAVLLSTTLWAFSNYQIDSSANYTEALIWTKLSGIGIISFIISVSFFSVNFPIATLTYKPFLFVLRIIGIVFGLTLLLTDSIVKSVDLAVFPVRVLYGGVYNYLIIWILIGLLANTGIILRKLSKLRGLVRTQLSLILISLSIVILVSLVTNLLLPLVGSSSFTRIGPSSTILLLGFVLILIAKYRLFDIRILFGKILYYLILSVFIFGFYYTAYFLNQQLFGTSVGIGSVLIGIPLAIIFIIFYSAATKFIQTQIDSTLISPDYDPAEVIADFNKEVSTTLDYENIANKAIAIFARTLRSTYEGIVTIHESNGEEIIQGKKTLANISEIVERTSKLWDVNGKFIVNYDLFELEFPQTYANVETELRALMDEMQKGAIKLIVPLGQREEMVGMVLIGQKEADAPYNSVELGFITSIADLTGLGLARAFLYREVQEFNNTLQQKVNQATQEIQDKNAKLEEALRNERDMLDILGHELRTPLGTARNAIVVLETLIEKKELTEENLKKYITISAENIRREVQLLETILASTKVDNDKLELKLENINAQEIVETSLQTYAEDAEKKGLTLKTELPVNPLECYADKIRIQQIMDNLTSNAIKYTQSGSVTLKLEEIDGSIKFSVIDTGEGIPEKEIPNLGRKFYRINNYLSSKGKLGDRQIVRPGGTGIGLYVVFQLVKAMKGRVEIQSKVGEGSTFSFVLPKAGLI